MDVAEDKHELEEVWFCSSCGAPQQARSCEQQPDPAIARDTSQQREQNNNADPSDASEHPSSSATPEQKFKYIGGRYRILELIGTGGVGSVYRVEHDMLNKIFALKLVHPDVIADFKITQRFQLEAQALADLSHPNITAVHDFGVSEEGAPYLVMEFLDGCTLDQEIKKQGHIEEHRALDIFKQICAGLSYAHSKGIVHRDLKPENIMLVKDDHGNTIPKIVDFGIAKRAAAKAKLTQTGDVFGTPVYMSPEQCLGQEVDVRSDIYSFGCIMYECLSGKQAFDGANAIEIIFKHVHEEPKALRKVCEGFEVSAGMEQIVASCLHIEAEFRPPSADALAINLARAAEGKSPLSTSVLPRIRKKQISRAAQIGSISIVSIVLFVLTTQLIPYLTEPEYKKMLIEAHRQFDSGEEENALWTGQQALKMALAQGSTVPASDLMHCYGAVFTFAERMGDYRKAASTADKAVKYAHDVNDLAAEDEYALQAARDERAFDGEKAQQWYKRALEVRQRRVGAESPEILRVLLEAGRCAYRHRTKDADVQDSILYLEQAAAILSRHRKNTLMSPAERYQLFDQLAISYDYLHRYKEAKMALAGAELLSKSAELESDDFAALKALHEAIDKHLQASDQQPDI